MRKSGTGGVLCVLCVLLFLTPKYIPTAIPTMTKMATGTPTPTLIPSIIPKLELLVLVTHASPAHSKPDPHLHADALTDPAVFATAEQFTTHVFPDHI